MDKEANTQRNFDEIVGVVIRRLNLFIIPLIIISIITVIVGSMLPKTYETSALVQIQTKNIVGAVVKDQATSHDVENEFETIVKQVTAWPRLEQMVSQLHLADNITSPADREIVIKAFKNRMRFVLKNGNLVEIAYQDRSPYNAQQVVNALASSLISMNDSMQKEEAKIAIGFIQQQLAIYKQKLDSSQQDVSASKLDTDLQTAVQKKLLLLEKIQSMQRIVPSQITNAENPAIAQLQARQGQLEMELAKISFDAKPDNPRVLSLKTEIKEIKDKIDAEMGKSNVKENVFMLNPLYVQAKQELKQVEMELETLNKRKKSTEGQDQTVPANVSETEITNIERNRAVDEDIYKMLLKQLEAAYVAERLENSENGNKYSVLEYARLPLQPVKPRMAMVAFMGLALGALSGLGLVFAVENLSGAFQTKEQVQDMLDIPFLSSISKMILEQDNAKKSLIIGLKEKINGFIQTNKMLSGLTFVTPHIAKQIRDKDISAQLVVYHEPNSVISDEFRILRTHIFHGAGDEKPPTTLILTSTLRGEGKSTTSSNLAVTIADSGRKTLLMDCDLRKGTVGNLFSIPASKGLIDVLSGEIQVDAAIKETKIKNLYVLHSGGGNRRPSAA